MPSCTNCDREFTTRAKRDYHLKQCLGVVTVIYPNGPITIKASKEGLFTCYCAHLDCPKSFNAPNGLIKHVKNVSQPWIGVTHAPEPTIQASTQSNSYTGDDQLQSQPTSLLAPTSMKPTLMTNAMAHQPMSDTGSLIRLGNSFSLDTPSENVDVLNNVNQPTILCGPSNENVAPVVIAHKNSLETQIIRHPYLDSLGLIVNTVLRCLCCEWCGITVSSKHAQTHFRNGPHNNKTFSIKQATFNAIAAELGIKDELPLPPNTPLGCPAPLPFQGLKTLEGYACSLCQQLTQSEKYLRNHYAKAHPGQSLPNTLAQCSMQRFSSGNIGPTRALFRVESKIPIKIQGLAAITSAIRNEMAQVLEVPRKRNNVDDRSVSPWLLTTKWHDHVRGYDVKELCSLVAFPTKHEFPGLQAVVQEYFAEATQEIETLQELTLQILNTADPAKTGINNTPLHRFQLEGTLNQYCNIIIRQLAMLMRDEETYSIPLSPQLEAALDQFEGALEGGDHDQAKDHLHSIFMCLWKHKWKPTADNTIPCPTIRALALLTLCPDGHFLEPFQVTGMIAKWERCIRLAFLKEIKVQSEIIEEEEACHILQPWFTEKANCPFNSLRSLQHRASAIAKTTMGLGKILWTDRVNWTSLLYEGTSISLAQLSRINQVMETELVNAWESKVLLGLKLRVDYDHLVEDLSNTNVGYSFLTDPRNHAFQHRDLLLVAVLEHTELRESFVHINKETGSITWNKSELRCWLHEYSQFQKLLLTRCETLAGGPGRSTEFTAMQQHNTEDRNSRSIHILDNYIAVVRMYHKSAQLTGTDKFIPHALDGITSDLLLQDLAIAKPFAQFVAHLCYPDRPDVQELYRDYLFVNNINLFGVESITEVLKTHTVQILGKPLGIRDWRHVTIAFKRKLCSEVMELYEGGYSGDSVFVQHAGHGRILEDRLYGLSPDALMGVAEDLLPLFMAGSTKWQILHKAVPGGLMLPYSKARFCKFDDLVNQGVIKLVNQQPHQTNKTENTDAIVDKVVEKLKPFLTNLIQDTVTSALGNITFSSTIQESNLLPAILEPVEAAAQQIVEDDEFDAIYASFPSPEPSHLPSAQLAPSLVVESAPTHQQAFTEQEALACIGSLLNIQEPTWTCIEQRVAMKAVLNCQQDILAVLKTSSGKSMLMVIPPLLEKNCITIGILPLNSLLLDYSRKFKAQGILFEVFNSKTSPKLTGHHNLILVTIDQARTKRWRQEIAELNQRIPVKRMVFDEGHYAITDQDFRAVLDDTYDLRQFPMQMVVLSGTIPPKSEKMVIDAFGLMDDTLIIRTPSNRPELAYIVEPSFATNSHIAQRVKAIIKDSQPLLQEKDRILVFVPFLDNGDHLAELLGCQFYCGGNNTTAQEKLVMYNNWISGKHKVMVCTNSFGAGNDYSHVPLVIHAGNPRHMMGYIQESSRAGRNKQPSRCIILSRRSGHGPPHASDLVDHKGELEMHQMLFGSQMDTCITHSLTEYNDGIGVQCSASPIQQLCSRCNSCTSQPSTSLPSKRVMENEAYSTNNANPFKSAFQASKRRMIAKHVSTTNYVARFRAALNWFCGTCSFCRVGGNRNSSIHDMPDCPTLRKAITPTQFLDFSRAIRYGKAHKTAICFRCHIPQLQDRLHSTFDSSGKSCSFPDTLAAVALYVFLDGDARKEACQYFASTWSSQKEFVAWLNGNPSEGHYSNISELFLWFVEISINGTVHS